ncbi:SGSM1 protein, partial [Amia calva]|nr:SGSM1 protein [Amia calva]
MEEAVTRKFVHEDSSHIVSFCAAVEACVLHGLKRRAAGFLRSNKIAALFMKVGKSFPLADDLCRKAQELEQIIETKRNQVPLNHEGARKLQKLPSMSPQAFKNLWIRTALIEKVLDKIVLYLVENSSKYYEKEAVLMDPVDGPILASLLVGPCALEYTKMKTADHFWTDPSADELVQRHRIHSGHCRQDSPTKRPALCIQKRHSSGSMDDRPSISARDYVESLHQNSRATLLYGKNNVLVQPRDDMEAIPGYLSLHQTADIMTLKWTPNQLMNGSVGDLDYEKSVYWDYAMTIRLEEIVYLHCHQQVDSGGTVVLVSQDGIQRPPLRFPRGGHLLQFLSCLENGLLPHGQLDPPLWSQRGKGKVFPKLRKRSPQGSSESVSDKEEDEATDYVFRILFPGSHSEFAPQDLMEQGAAMWHPTARKSSCSSCSQSGFSEGGPPNGCNHERAPLKLLCDNMKYQIISRAFYGWLAYCRHLSTVRTHLSALVNHTIVDPAVPQDASRGLTTDIWQKYLQDCTAYEEQELLRLVYFGGVEPSLRKEAWPFLLGHYQFGMSETERKEVDDQVRACYEQTMSEWLGCEAIVRQREKEQHAAALAKCSSGASLDSQIQKMMHRDSTVSNESSQSCSSDRPSHARLQSDSSSSTQHACFNHVTVTMSCECLWNAAITTPVFVIMLVYTHTTCVITNVISLPAVCHYNHSDPPSTVCVFSHPPLYLLPVIISIFSFTYLNILNIVQPKTFNSSGNVTKIIQQNIFYISSSSNSRSLSRKRSTHSNLITVRHSSCCSKERLRNIFMSFGAPGGSNCQVYYLQYSICSVRPVFRRQRNELTCLNWYCSSPIPSAPPPTAARCMPTSPAITSPSPSRLLPCGLSFQVFESVEEVEQIETEPKGEESKQAAKVPNGVLPNGTSSPDSGHPSSRNFSITSGFSDRSLSADDSAGTDKKPPAETQEEAPQEKEAIEAKALEPEEAALITKEEDAGEAASLPVLEMQVDEEAERQSLVGSEDALSEEPEMESLFPQFDSLVVRGEVKNDATSPVSSIGTTYSQELLDMYTVNLHRIEKDVQRCDRNYWYFTPSNLEKLRNIMCSYVWQHLEIGYVQGMCDLLAPLLVILDDEAMAFSCFTELMKRMNQNFPHGGAMDTHFANMRSLIQILDSELFELMHQNGDYTHFYFCYRWFLLDFKRELVYDDVFSVWETIWAAKHVSSSHFVLFIALALVELYRDIILENNMDFTDIIKFFNEMAEHHNTKQVLKQARDLVYKVQTLIENK